MTKLDFKGILDEYMKSNQKEWVHDRSLTVGASEAFGCIRKTFYSKTGAEKDKDHVDRWGAAERGNIIEDHFLVPAFVNHLPEGAESFGMGDAQETLVKGVNSATCDGLISGLAKDALADYGIEDIEGDCILTEFKSVDPRILLTEEKAIHRGQANIQLALVRELTDFKPTYAVIIYVNCSFLDDVTVFPIKYDPKVYNNAKKRAKRVFAKDAKASDFIKEGKINGACEYCPYTEVCWKNTQEAHSDETKTNFEKAVLEQAEELFIRYQEQQLNQKNAEASKKEIGEEIKKFLSDNDTNRVSTDFYNMSNSLQPGRSTYDYEAMREDGIDVDRYKKNGPGFEKLTVTKKKV